MKKAYLAAIIFLCILVAFTLSANSNNSKINWIDFVRLEDKYYAKQDIEISTDNIGEKIGSVESNSPKRSCKWIPQNNEASKLPIGTEVYELKHESLEGVAVYYKGKYILYEIVTEAEITK